MKSNNKINLKSFYIFLGFLILFFSILIFINEYILISGEKVYLKTVVIDPRDLLRGDYFILNYEIIQNNKVKKFIQNKSLTNGENIYIILNKDKNNVGNFNKISLNKPKSGIFIKGKIDKKYYWNYLKLGIEKYFIPQGKGREITRLGNKLKVLVSIDKFGNSRIVDLYNNGVKIDFNNKNIN